MIRPWWGGGPRRGIRSRFKETFVRGEPLPGARPTSPGWHRSFPRRGTGPGPSLIARGRVGDACPARWASADLVRRDMAPRANVARGPAKGGGSLDPVAFGGQSAFWTPGRDRPRLQRGGGPRENPKAACPAPHTIPLAARGVMGGWGIWGAGDCELGLWLIRPAAHRFEPGRKGDPGTGSHGGSPGGKSTGSEIPRSARPGPANSRQSAAHLGSRSRSLLAARSWV